MRTITITTYSARTFGLPARALAFFLMLVLAACSAGPPVQEMSDARQAIAVAREAGAAEYEPDNLRDAEAYLDSAEDKLSRRSYTQARSDALAAKDKALEALSIAERSQRDNPN